MASSEEIPLPFITKVLGVFGIAPSSFNVERNAKATNNNVFVIHLKKPTTSDLLFKSAKALPLTNPIPTSTSSLVLRIPKIDNNVQDNVRVRNEVACLYLARQALSEADRPLIPRVFSWSDAIAAGGGTAVEDDKDYILEEFLGGETMSWDELKALNEEDRDAICAQFARVAKVWQAYQLPDDITGYGSITFDDAGRFSSTESVFRVGGPYKTYADYLNATIQWQLKQSDNVAYLNGWKTCEEFPGLRSRIDAFLANKLPALLADIPEHKPCLVHGDLTLPNLHFNKKTNRLVGILDFDFGHTGSPLTEAMYSFAEFGGLLWGRGDGDDRSALLSGFPEPVKPEDALGHAWDKALAAEGAQRPSTIKEAEMVSDLWWFGQELCYFHWLLPRFHEKTTDGQKKKSFDKSAKAIDVYLKHWGH